MKEFLICIDDEASILNSLKRIFRHEDYEVRSTQDINQVIEWIHKFPVKAVISDFRMKGVTGLEVLRKVRELDPSIGRLILSGYANQKLVNEALASGDIHGYLTKPCDNDFLKNSLKRFFPNAREWEEV